MRDCEEDQLEGRRIPWQQGKESLHSLISSYGVAQDESNILVDNLCWNSAIGRYTQGIWRLPYLLKRLEAGLIQSPCKIKVTQQSPALANLDGGNGFGQYVSQQAMCKAIAIAKEQGVGIIGVKSSNWNGSGAFYANLASTEGCIGICTSNSFPRVAAHNGSRAALGTNPIAFSAPRKHGRHLLVDMATSIKSGSTSTRRLRKQVSDIDLSVAHSTSSDTRKNEVLYPFGGAKGFALGMVAEILSSVITGAGITHEVASLHKDFSRPGNNGHFFMALNIEHLMPMETYYSRIENLLSSILSSDQENIRLPGQSRWDMMEESLKKGLFIEHETLEQLNTLGRSKSISFAL